jgi:hypothetical protein
MTEIIDLIERKAYEDLKDVNKEKIFEFASNFLLQAGICKKLNKLEKSYYWMTKYFLFSFF